MSPATLAAYPSAAAAVDAVVADDLLRQALMVRQGLGFSTYHAFRHHDAPGPHAPRNATEQQPNGPLLEVLQCRPRSMSEAGQYEPFGGCS